MTKAELVESYLASFATRDPDQVVSHVSDDFENNQMCALGESCSGKEVYRERLQSFFALFSSLSYVIEDIIVAKDSVAVAYLMQARQTGKPLKIHGVMLINVTAGKIIKRSDYWDALSYQQQLDG